MKLVDDSIAQLFTIPASDWEAINKRVGLVLMAADITSEIKSELPGFGILLTACQSWSNGTFQALIDQSNALNTYATTAIANFTALKQSVDALEGNTVPLNVQQQTNMALSQLSADTAPLLQSFATLTNQVSDFMYDNLAVDSQLSDIQSRFRLVAWQPLSTITTAVNHATGLVYGAFRAINADLKSAVSDQIDVTMPFLESLSLEVAIKTWQTIQTETAAFPSMVNEQKIFWQPQGM